MNTWKTPDNRYLGVTEYDSTESAYVTKYIGFVNVLNISEVPISDWTLGMTASPSGSGSKNTYGGDENGFSGDGKTYGPCHILWSTPGEYALGVIAVRNVVAGAVAFGYNVVLWRKENPTLWYNICGLTYDGVSFNWPADIPEIIANAPPVVRLVAMDVSATSNAKRFGLVALNGDQINAVVPEAFAHWRSSYLTSAPINRVAQAVPPLIATTDNPVEFKDPYQPGGESGPDGGGGDFDNSSTPIPHPTAPTLSAVDTGFLTLYSPSLSQIKDLANYMWSDGFDLNAFKKLFADPMDVILGLSIVPVSPTKGPLTTIKVGNISTGVSMPIVSDQYVTVNCGTLNINEYWGAYLDYAPYTKAELYLPFIGTHPIEIDDIMKKPVNIQYIFDLLSGSCCATVMCGESVLYTFLGQCSAQVPVTGNDWGNIITSAISIAGSIGAMVATGGATAPMAVGSIASAAVNGLKPTVEKSGSLSGAGGLMGVQTPYIILTRPRQALPSHQNTFTGYPAFVTATLSELSGYTEIDSIHLEGIPATDPELNEIEELLEGGVIL